MILTASHVCKVLMAALPIVIIWIAARKAGRTVGFRTAVSLFLLIAAFLAWTASEVIPPITDAVTITALGEKSENAKADEVFISGFTIDGVSYPANSKTLKILKGKWFWGGNNYCWRNELDKRQPEGTTRTVVLAVPVGLKRSISFENNEWRGLAEVQSGDLTQTVDTSASKSALLDRSDTRALLWNQARKLLAFAVVMLTAIYGVWYTLCCEEKVIKWISKYHFRLLCGCLSLTAYILMTNWADTKGLWNDELSQILCSKSLQNAIQNCLTMYDITPPLFSALNVLWYHIAPYGEKWLLQINIIPVALATYIMALVGERVGGRYCGMLAAASLAFSTTVWGYIAWEYRSYAFVLLFTSVALYCHVMRSDMTQSAKWRVGYSVSLLCLCMSHYFGMLMCGIFFAMDFLLLLDKKMKSSELLLLVPPMAASAIWLLLVYRTTLSGKALEQIASWYAVPNITHVLSLLRFLTGSYGITYGLFLLGLAAAVFYFPGRDHENRKAAFYAKFSAAAILGTVTLLLFYGNFVNRASTMWQPRYFFILLPFVSLLTALGPVILLHDSTSQGSGWRKPLLLALAIGLLLTNCIEKGPGVSVGSPNCREAADWLYGQRNYIFNDDTLIVATMGTVAVAGWDEYYIAQMGRRDDLNVVSQYEIEMHSGKLKDQYNRIYIYEYHHAMSEPLKEYLNEFYTLDSKKNDVGMKIYARKG